MGRQFLRISGFFLLAILAIGLGACNKFTGKSASGGSDLPGDSAKVDPASLAGGKPYPVNAAQYQSLILDPKRLVVVDFHADWCGPCRKLSPIMEAMAAEFAGNVLFLKVDVDENRVLTSEIGVKSIPDVRMFAAGQQVHHTVGLLTPEELRGTIKEHLPAKPSDGGAVVLPPAAPARPSVAPAVPAKPAQPEPSLLDRLKKALPGGSAGEPAKPKGPDGKEIIPPIRPSKPNEEWLPPGMSKGPQPPPSAPPPTTKGK